jgi:hypothetical protein
VCRPGMAPVLCSFDSRGRRLPSFALSSVSFSTSRWHTGHRATGLWGLDRHIDDIAPILAIMPAYSGAKVDVGGFSETTGHRRPTSWLPVGRSNVRFRNRLRRIVSRLRDNEVALRQSQNMTGLMLMPMKRELTSAGLFIVL